MNNDHKELMDFSFTYEALDACPLCACSVMLPNGKESWLSYEFLYVICPQCGLKFMNPRPTIDSYKDFYANYFWQQKIRNIGFVKKGQMWQKANRKWDTDGDWDPEEGKKNKMEKAKAIRFPVINETLSAHGPITKDTQMLEVGCGFAVALNEFQTQYGAQVHAIEPSVEAQEQIALFGIPLVGQYAEDLEALSKEDKKYDRIIFSHSLENSVYPFKVMAWARDCLKDGGVIYVQCSNMYTYDQMNPYHPFIFSHNPFSVLAQKLGMAYKRFSDPADHMLTVTFTK